MISNAAVRLEIFAILSVALIAGFWRIARTGWTHAVPRLLAFEAILGLILVNAPGWFVAPLVPRQLVSWTLLAASMLLAWHGFSLLRGAGAPVGGIETTTRVVRRGAYRFIRHPLYLSLMLFSAGAFLKDPGLLAGALLMVAIAALGVTAATEEQENLRRFGEPYREYMRTTKRFIPFLV